MLCSRVDALVLAYQGDLNPAVTRRLNDALREGVDAATDERVDIGNIAFALQRSGSRPGRWVLRNGDLGLVVEESTERSGWLLEVTVRAKFLATSGADAAVEAARAIQEIIVPCATGERIRRVDLCADVIGFEPTSIDERAWLTPQRADVRKYAVTSTGQAVEKKRRSAVWQDAESGEPVTKHLRGAKCTGYTIGKSDVSVRIYDKRVELAARRDEEKQAIEEERWRAAGWNGADAVTRVELQLRGGVLAEFDHGILRENPNKLLARLDAVWAYGTQKWLRLVAEYRPKRMDRVPADPRWAVVQCATFNGEVVSKGDIPGRKRHRGLAAARLALGVVTNYAARVGELQGLPMRDVRVWLAGKVEWSDDDRRRFVQRRVRHIFEKAADAVANDLIVGLGDDPLRAAEHVLKRQDAAWARFVKIAEQRPLLHPESEIVLRAKSRRPSREASAAPGGAASSSDRVDKPSPGAPRDAWASPGAGNDARASLGAGNDGRPLFTA